MNPTVSIYMQTAQDPCEEWAEFSGTLRQVLDDGWARLSEPSTVAREKLLVPVDVIDAGDALIVRANLPGVERERLEIKLQGNSLSLRGEVTPQEVPEGAVYLCHERHSFFLNRRLDLPAAVDASQAEAVLEHGLLTLSLPKIETRLVAMAGVL